MTGSRRLGYRAAAVGAASIAVAAIASAPALAHVPGTGFGLPPTTNAPDLRSVEVGASSLTDVLAEQARYCFDQNISTVSGPAAFALQTYDARRAMNPTAAARDTGNEKCAIVSFAPGTDITQATVGEVAPGAVTDLQNRTNLTASEPAIGSVHTRFPGATTGPDLQDVVVNVASATDKRATYVFDETLDPATPFVSTSFGYYDGTDLPVFAPLAAVSVDGRSATVSFGAGAGLETATRFFVNSGAVQDRPQTISLDGLPLATPSSPDVLNKGAVSPARPEMVSATAQGPQIFRVLFNVPVSVATATAAGFLAISDDATVTPPATSVGSGGADNAVTITFPASVASDPTGIVRIFVGGGSIRNADGSLQNLGGTVPASTPNSFPGLTNGPDLLAVAVDTATSRVTYKYDENVAETAPPPSALQGMAVDGAAINALDGVVATGNTVSARFPASVASAVMFANPFNTLRDRTGRPNPHQSVSKALQAGPPAPPIVAPPAPPPPPVVVVKTRYKTTITIKRRGRVYSGVVKSSLKACSQRRKVQLKRNGKAFGTARTSSTGRYTIKRSRRLRGRVYVTAPAVSSKTITCRAGKSKRIRG